MAPHNHFECGAIPLRRQSRQLRVGDIFGVRGWNPVHNFLQLRLPTHDLCAANVMLE